LLLIFFLSLSSLTYLVSAELTNEEKNELPIIDLSVDVLDVDLTRKLLTIEIDINIYNYYSNETEVS
jgi:hypothetical protein